MSEITEPKKDLEVLWTPKQVASYLLVHIVTVYNWIRTGKVFEPSRIVRFGSRVRIPRGEVERIAGQIKKQLTPQ